MLCIFICIIFHIIWHILHIFCMCNMQNNAKYGPCTIIFLHYILHIAAYIWIIVCKICKKNMLHQNSIRKICKINMQTLYSICRIVQGPYFAYFAYLWPPTLLMFWVKRGRSTRLGPAWPVKWVPSYWPNTHHLCGLVVSSLAIICDSLRCLQFERFKTNYPSRSHVHFYYFIN